MDTLRQVLKPLTPATATKVLRRCGTVLDLAKASGHVVTNAARDLSATRRGLSNGKKKHRKALPWRDVPALESQVSGFADRNGFPLSRE